MKFTLDTNLYIDGFRREQAQTEIFGFFARALPFLHLSAIVMQELAAGARSADAARDVERGIFDPFIRRGRVFTPSSAAFADSGRVLAAVAAREGWTRVPFENPSFANDALLAASCREQGTTLITRDADFARLAPFVPGFRHVAPWPTLGGK